MRSVERKAQKGRSLLRRGPLWGNSPVLSPVRGTRRCAGVPGAGAAVRAGTVVAMDTSWWLALAAVVLLALVATLVDGWGRRGHGVAGAARPPGVGRGGRRGGRGPGAAAAGRGGDLVGERSVRGRARGRRTGRVWCWPCAGGRVRRREDHQQVPRRAGRGDSAAARGGGGRAGAGELPGDGRAAGGCRCGTSGGGWGWWTRWCGTRSGTWRADGRRRSAAPAVPYPARRGPPRRLSAGRCRTPAHVAPDAAAVPAACRRAERGRAAGSRPTPAGTHGSASPSGAETLRPELALQRLDGFLRRGGRVDARRQVLPAAVGDDEDDVGGLARRDAPSGRRRSPRAARRRWRRPRRCPPAGAVPGCG